MRFGAVLRRCHCRDRLASGGQRARTDQPTGSSSSGGGSGGATTSPTGGAAATSSARRPSGRMRGVPQRLQDITAPNSDHFQHVGQQTFMTTAHSHQPDATGRSPSVDGAETVTGSAQIGAVRQAAWDRRSISHSIPTIVAPTAPRMKSPASAVAPSRSDSRSSTSRSERPARTAPACAHGHDDCRDAHAGARLPGDRVLATGSRCADD